MRIFIHGFKSLVRRPAKTGMLLVILIVVFVLVFTGFIIQNSINQSKIYIRNQIGGVVEYRTDTSSALGAGIRSIPALSRKVAEKIASSRYVEKYFITESANVESDTIDPANAQQQQAGAVFQQNFSDFTMKGSNQTDNIDFAMGNIILSEGRMMTPAELAGGDKVVLISQEVADANYLKAGDVIELSLVTLQMRVWNPGGSTGSTGGSAAGAAPVEYEVIGIYEAQNADFNLNTIFTSNTVIDEIRGTVNTDDTNASVVFMLNSPTDVDAFIKESTPYLTSEYHILYSNDDEYESLTKPLDLISLITTLLIWVVFIAGAAIILAVVTIFVRDRKFEIGLLLSSGEAKLKIVSQFIFEMLVIAVIAFLISSVSSSMISKSVGSWIVENQLLSDTSLIGSTSTEAGIQLPAGRPGNSGMRVIAGSVPAILRGGQTASLYGDVNMQDVADEFDVTLSTPVLFKLLLASVLLILIGACIPLTVITGFEPKKILQDY
ncbi:MAG: ABC transporter permease [Eubacteriales bacterium]|nr:ABC transporter permease [Eubacteriales bacterium]